MTGVPCLYRDDDLCVIVKPVGRISEDGADPESVCPLICGTLGVKKVFPVHRLDRSVGGVMVYALSQRAAKALSSAVSDGGLSKTYLALTHGVPETPCGHYTDLLFKDARKNKVFVVDRMRRGVRRAELDYETLAVLDGGARALVRVRLVTGRSHQIRVQFASRKTPLVGDGKYGAVDHEKQIGLFSHAISFVHPFTGETLCFSVLPSDGAFAGLPDETLSALV